MKNGACFWNLNSCECRGPPVCIWLDSKICALQNSNTQPHMRSVRVCFERAVNHMERTSLQTSMKRNKLSRARSLRSMNPWVWLHVAAVWGTKSKKNQNEDIVFSLGGWTRCFQVCRYESISVTTQMWPKIGHRTHELITCVLCKTGNSPSSIQRFGLQEAHASRVLCFRKGHCEGVSNVGLKLGGMWKN